METAMVEQNAGETFKLELKRVIKASKKRVFDAWTRPEYVRHWFGPKNMVAGELATDAREGGEYRFEANPTPESGVDPARIAVAKGTYKTVQPYDLLVFTWNDTWYPEEVSLVTVMLKDVDGGTELTLRHEQFNSERSREGHTPGWEGALVKLKRFAESA
jgi:uncharacterized protein YndB with AHSA1/START domain